MQFVLVVAYTKVEQRVEMIMRRIPPLLRTENENDSTC
jgi:hypothetical protein